MRSRCSPRALDVLRVRRSSLRPTRDTFEAGPRFRGPGLNQLMGGRSDAAPFEFSRGMRLTKTVIAGLVPTAFTHLSCRLRSPRSGQASAVPLRLSSRIALALRSLVRGAGRGWAMEKMGGA